MQINFIDTDKINTIFIHIINEKEFDKFINVLRFVDDIVIKDKMYRIDYINLVPEETEIMFSHIDVGIHEVE